MATSPNIQGAVVGTGEAQKALDAATTQLARITEEKAKLAQREVEVMRARVAQVEASGVSTSELVPGSHGSMIEQVVSSRSKELRDDILTRSHNKKIQEEQAQESAESVATEFKNLGKAVGITTAALAVLASAANETASLQKSGARRVGGIQESLGASLRSLGAHGDQIDEITNRVTSGQFGSAATPEEIAGLLETADSAKGLLPGNPQTLRQTLDVIQEVASGGRDVRWGMKTLAAGHGFPKSVSGLTKAGTSSAPGSAAIASSRQRVGIENSVIASQSRTQLEGQAVEQYDAEEDRIMREEPWLGWAMHANPAYWVTGYWLGRIGAKNGAREADDDYNAFAERLKKSREAKRQQPPVRVIIDGAPPAASGGNHQ